jgi:ribose transport system substrate-binding protein
LIAIDIPHPHASYFGVDNFQVGFEAGELLAQHATAKWKKKADWVLGLDVAEAGSFVQSRITGAFEGVRSLLPEIPQESFIRLDGRGMRETSTRVISDFFKRHSKTDRILIAAATDTSALGALQATIDAQREKIVAIVGQDCIPEVLDELKKPQSPIIGSISHEAQTYGPRLIQLGVAILRGQLRAASRGNGWNDARGRIDPRLKPGDVGTARRTGCAAIAAGLPYARSWRQR